MTTAVWALTGVLLLLAGVIGAVGYVWATTSHLDRRLSEAEVRAITGVDDWFRWPVLDSEPDGGEPA
jgi:nitrate reductase gamma subunit